MRHAVVPLSPQLYYYNNFGNSIESQVMPSLDISMPMDSSSSSSRLVNLESLCWDSIPCSNYQLQPPVSAAAASFHLTTPQQSFITTTTSSYDLPLEGYGSYSSSFSSSETMSNQSMMMMMIKEVSSAPPPPTTTSPENQQSFQSREVVVRKRPNEVGSIGSKGGKKKTKKSCTPTCEDTWQQQMYQQSFTSHHQFKEEAVPVRRRQKLSDKITALQKLVSPYGKTDTASVLQEASVYIKMLHKQLQMLSDSSGSSSSEELCVGELKRRGLCVVPLSLTNKIGDINIMDPSHYVYSGDDQVEVEAVA